MARLVWDAIGERQYETGVDRGVLYVDSLPGVPWNGLTSISEDPSGGGADPYYIDGEKYLNLCEAEEFQGTIQAYTYPDEFIPCEGLSQPFHGLFVTAQYKKSFGLCYRSKIGNDTDGLDHAYKLHLIYNATAEPSQKSHDTISDQTSAFTFSWKISTKPPIVPGFKNTAHIIIDTRFVDPITLGVLEDALYGTSAVAAHLPTPTELFALFTAYSSFVVVDHGDGTWTASGTALEVIDNGDGTFNIDSPSATMISSDTYTLFSP